jgi:hypothetical protein
MTHDLVRITVKEARRFLSELANLSDDKKALVRFEKFCGQILPKEAKRISFDELKKANPGLIGLIDENHPLEVIWAYALRSALRKIWRVTDRRTKEWAILRLADVCTFKSLGPEVHRKLLESDDPLDPLPPETPIEQILDYLRSEAHRLAHCANDECPAPFFFSVRSSQRYCSSRCALPFQRKSKRDWWTKNRAKRHARNRDA